MTAEEMLVIRWVDIKMWEKLRQPLALGDHAMVLFEYRRCRRLIRDGNLNR